MTWRWTVWTTSIMALALLLLTPLRFVLPTKDFERLGLSARQVGGTIWHGRIGDLMLGRQLLGTFDVRLDPAALLLGRIAMPFERLGSEQGPLTGVLRTGGSVQGVEYLTGTFPTGSFFGAAPIDTLELKDTTILFRNARCEQADGQIRVNMALRVGPIDLSRSFSGTVACEGQRVRARLTSPGNREQIEFFVNSSGRVRGWVTIPVAVPGLEAILATYGFQTGSNGLVLPFETRL